MEEAYVYCIPIAENEVKIGSHLGSIKKLDARYATYVNKNFLAQKRFIRVEPPYRVAFERTIQALIKRVDGGALFVENERFQRSAELLFETLAPSYALSPLPSVDATPVGIAEEKDCKKKSGASEIEQKFADEIEHKFRQMQLERKLNAVERYEREKKKAMEKDIRDLMKTDHLSKACGDFYSQFITIKPQEAIKWKDIMARFWPWYIQHYAAAPHMDKRLMKRWFVDKLGPERCSSVRGIKSKSFFGYQLQ